MIKNITLRNSLSLLSFVAALIVGFIALFLPPTGIIDASVLWYTAQLLVFTSGLLGINMNIDSLKQIAKTTTTKNEDNK